MATTSLPWIGSRETSPQRAGTSGSRQHSPVGTARIGEQQQTTASGLEFIGSISKDIARVGDEVVMLQAAMDRLRADLAVEAHTRGGELGATQHKTSSDLADAMSRLRQETDHRCDTFEATTTHWARALGQEIQALKPRLESIEKALPTQMSAHAVAEGRLATVEQVLPALQRDLVGINENHTSRVMDVEAQLGVHREQAGMQARAIAANGAQEIKRLEEQVEKLRQQEQMTEGTLQASLHTIDALSEKLCRTEALAHARAKVEDMDAMEAKWNTTLERSVRSLSEELSRKETIVTVSNVWEQVNQLSLALQGGMAKARAEEESLARQLTDLDASLTKAARQADADRDRSNTCIVSLGKDLQTKAAKSDVEALPGRIASVEAAVEPLAPALATKASSEEVKRLHNRALQLESGLNNKASLDEFPRLHMALAEHKARHEAKHAELEARGHEHAGRFERNRSIEDEHRTRLEILEHHGRELQGQLASKAEADAVLTKEVSEMLVKDFYRREEIDAMMTRVWWRVGDHNKSPKSTLPQLPHALKR